MFKRCLIVFILFTNLTGFVSYAQEVNFQLGLIGGYLPQADKKDNFKNSYWAIKPQVQTSWTAEDETWLVEFKAIGFFHKHDEEIKHTDIRDLYYLYLLDYTEFKVGISSVFWGVAESQNLVNIINQQDSSVGFDNEEKLGQPMFQLTQDFKDNGVSNFFILPYFREKPKTPETLGANPNLKSALYQSNDEDKHLDVAFRHNFWIDEHEMAFSYFDGTDRNPIYVTQQGSLHPYYYLMKQYGIEYQYSAEGWLWKLEVINKKRQSQTEYRAAVGGFEYTFVGFYSEADLGLIIEYNYDDREKLSDNLLQKDTLIGFRYVANDVDDSSVLATVVYDHHYQSYLFNVLAETRLAENFNINAKINIFQLKDEDPFSQTFNHLDKLGFELTYYF